MNTSEMSTTDNVYRVYWPKTETWSAAFEDIASAREYAKAEAHLEERRTRKKFYLRVLTEFPGDVTIPSMSITETESRNRMIEGFSRMFGDAPTEFELAELFRLGRLAGVDPIAYTFDEMDTAIWKMLNALRRRA